MITTPEDELPSGTRASPTDAEVIRASWSEPERFADIYDAYVDDIHRYVERRLGRDEADDVAAETFLEAFRQRERYDVDRPYARPWLYGIATNLVGRHRRQEVARYRAMARSAAEPAASAADTSTDRVADGVADRLTARAAQPALVRALGRLSPGDRDVVLLLALAQLGHAEVAEALGIPVGTVRSRLHRARRQLRSALPHDVVTTLELGHG
jgi:RNA polymerase sigma-70 factor, ECF subfamily